MGNNNKKMIVEKFDINRFNKNGSEYTFIDNGIEVRQVIINSDSSDRFFGYFEERKQVNSPYEYYNEYNIEGNPIKSMTLFYQMKVKIGKYYDLSGNIVKEENFDTYSLFSIDMLIEKMKGNYDVGITDTRNCQRITRGFYEEINNTPMYEVWRKTHKITGEFIYYLINDNTGETLSTTNRFPNKKRSSLFNEYMESLKQ